MFLFLFAVFSVRMRRDKLFWIFKFFTKMQIMKCIQTPVREIFIWRSSDGFFLEFRRFLSFTQLDVSEKLVVINPNVPRSNNFVRVQHFSVSREKSGVYWGKSVVPEFFSWSSIYFISKKIKTMAIFQTANIRPEAFQICWEVSQSFGFLQEFAGFYRERIPIFLEDILLISNLLIFNICQYSRKYFGIFWKITYQWLICFCLKFQIETFWCKCDICLNFSNCRFFLMSNLDWNIVSISSLF